MTPDLHPKVVVEKFKTECKIEGLFIREDGSDLTCPTDMLNLDLEGIRHSSDRSKKYYGFTRTSDRRAPWLKQGIPVRNQRQITMVAKEDLAELSAKLGIEQIRPEWLNANIFVSGLPGFSSLPRGTRFRFSDGGCILSEDRAYPCSSSARAVQKQYPDLDRIQTEFVREARTLRGLICTVEQGGRLSGGESFEVLVPEQWIYAPADS